MRYLIAIAALMMLVGCSNKPDTQIVDTSCSWVKPIFIGKGDKLTNKTAEEILAHDDKWKLFCGSKG
jgi:uncharacterized lipoprotein YehR (DUF1307 family)